MSLYVDETGTPGAASIVFLHGIGASGWMWTLQTAALADFHCLNVDLPGHGKSNQIPWVSLADTAEQLAAVIRGVPPTAERTSSGCRSARTSRWRCSNAMRGWRIGWLSAESPPSRGPTGRSSARSCG